MFSQLSKSYFREEEKRIEITLNLTKSLAEGAFSPKIFLLFYILSLEFVCVRRYFITAYLFTYFMMMLTWDNQIDSVND